jgi:CoA-transferase family III
MMPLAGWAQRQLAALARASGSAEIAVLSGAGLLAERALLNAFAIPGDVSAGGGCQLLQSLDGAIALNLSRPADRDLLPALFETEMDGNDDAAIAEHIALRGSDWLVGRGREMGLAIAGVAEDRSGASPAVDHILPSRIEPRDGVPKVLDLSALWAGPLTGRLLRLAGGDVTKVESSARPDAMRDGDPALFARLNCGKHQIALDLRSAEGMAKLESLIANADIVIEAARPRALLQMGIDAELLVQQRPGLIWLTITGHGVCGEAANWVAFGDDAGVAGGLSAALLEATGGLGFVGDAIADPLTGLFAARTGWDHWRAGQGGRFFFSMSGVIAQALAEKRARDPDGLKRDLQNWADRKGQSFSG